MAVVSTPFRTVLAALWLVLCLSIPLSTALFMSEAHFEGPYLEMWFELRALADFEANGNWWSGLFRLNNEHLVQPARLFYLAEYLFFGGRNVFLLTCVFAFQAAVAGTLIWFTRRYAGLGRTEQLVLIGLALVTAFCAQQAENFTSPFQLHFIMAPGAAIASVCFMVAHLQDGSRRWLWMSCIAAVVATWSLATGCLVWGLLLALLRTRQASRRDMAIVCTFAVLAIGFYAAQFLLVRDDYGGVKLPEEIAFRNIPAGVVLFLGLPVRLASPWLCAVLGVIGCVLGIWSLVSITRSLSPRSPLQQCAIALMAFFFLHAVIIGAARAAGDVGAAGSSRYVSYAGPFWWAAVAMGISAADSTRRRRLVSMLTVAVVAIAIIPWHFRLGAHVAETARLKRRAMLALTVGVPDPVIRVLFQHDDLSRVAAFLKERRLGYFRQPWTHTVHQSLDDVWRITDDPKLRGAFTAIEAVPAPLPDRPPIPYTSGIMVHGTLRTVDMKNRRPDLIALVDGEDRIRGFARTDGLHSDALPLVERMEWGDRPWFGWRVRDHSAVVAPLDLAGYRPVHAMGPGEGDAGWDMSWFGYARTEDATELRAYAIDRKAGTATLLEGQHRVSNDPS